MAKRRCLISRPLDRGTTLFPSPQLESVDKRRNLTSPATADWSAVASRESACAGARFAPANRAMGEGADTLQAHSASTKSPSAPVALYCLRCIRTLTLTLSLVRERASVRDLRQLAVPPLHAENSLSTLSLVVGAGEGSDTPKANHWCTMGMGFLPARLHPHPNPLPGQGEGISHRSNRQSGIGSSKLFAAARLSASKSHQAFHRATPLLESLAPRLRSYHLSLALSLDKEGGQK